MRCETMFFETYHRFPEGIAFCPYRICPIGAHSDHNLGKITGFAIDRGIHIAYASDKSGTTEMVSLNFPGIVRWQINETPGEKTGGWGDYLRGAAAALGKRYALHTGLQGVVEGTLPVGGLSSSAALILSFLEALCRVNGILPDAQEMIDIAFDAEKNYVGVSVGKLDQGCEVLSRAKHLLYLDTADGTYELIPQAGNMKLFRLAVFFSGVERSLISSGFNMRVDELRSAAYALMAFSGMEYGKFHETNMRCVPREVYERYKDKLPDNWRKRAEHWWSEFDRVQQGAEAWREGDIDTFGRLCSASGWSSIQNWETGSPELTTLYEIMTRTDGIYGGRFSGAGFKGCCMALIDPAYQETIERSVREAYLKAFPALSDRYSAYFCDPADGIAAMRG